MDEKACREAFEKWFAEECGVSAAMMLETTVKDGPYIYVQTSSAWFAWKAAWQAALATVAPVHQSEAVAEFVCNGPDIGSVNWLVHQGHALQDGDLLYASPQELTPNARRTLAVLQPDHFIACKFSFSNNVPVELALHNIDTGTFHKLYTAPPSVEALKLALSGTEQLREAWEGRARDFEAETNQLRADLAKSNERLAEVARELLAAKAALNATIPVLTAAHSGVPEGYVAIPTTETLLGKGFIKFAHYALMVMTLGSAWLAWWLWNPGYLMLAVFGCTVLILPAKKAIKKLSAAPAMLNSTPAIPAPSPERDNCQLCLGIKGGVRGNENRKHGVVMCDYCSAVFIKAASPNAEHSKEEAK